MTTLYLTTSDQHLITAQKVKIASGDINSVQLCVTFDSLWDNYPARTAVFYTSNDDTRIEVLLIDNACVIPSEVLTESCILYVGIRGVSSDGTKVKTSAIVQHKIVPGVGSGKTTISPTMDLYQQYIAAMDNRVDPIFNEIRTKLAEDFAEQLSGITDFLEADVLWENPSPDERFAAQTIEMDLSKYKRFSVLFRGSCRSDSEHYEVDFSEKNVLQSVSCSETYMGDSYFLGRQLTFLNTGVQITKSVDASGKENNKKIVPIKIKGYIY